MKSSIDSSIVLVPFTIPSTAGKSSRAPGSPYDNTVVQCRRTTLFQDIVSVLLLPTCFRLLFFSPTPLRVFFAHELPIGFVHTFPRLLHTYSMKHIPHYTSAAVDVMYHSSWCRAQTSSADARHRFFVISARVPCDFPHV